MQLVSIIARDGNGPLRIVQDRKPFSHSDDHAELDAALAARIAAGDDMVLILATDDSVLRHWTRPPNQVVQGDVQREAPSGRAARRHVAKKAGAKKRK